MNELKLDRTYKRGDKSPRVAVIQEWLGLSGILVKIDADYGKITESAVRRFQRVNGVTETGEVDDATYALLTAPMHEALQNINASTHALPALCVRWAEQQLASSPREIGGQNMGPWVRLYMKGAQGVPWAWCAGFASFCLERASSSLNVPVPMKTSFSCDELAGNAKHVGRFVACEDAGERARVAPGSLFLVRGQKPNDWVHTGVVTQLDGDAVHTIEGNTNDEGSREGYEVCRRVRRYMSADYVVI